MQLEEMDKEVKHVTNVTTQFLGSIVQDEKLDQLIMQLHKAQRNIAMLRKLLKEMPLVVQIMKATELKELQQCVTKEREHQQRRTMQLEEFQYIGAQLSMKAVSALQVVQDGCRDVTAKITKHPLERKVTECREVNEKVKEQVKEVT